MKEVSTVELRAEKQKLIARSKEILETAKKEVRKLTDQEGNELSDNQIRMGEISVELEARNEVNAGKSISHVQKKTYSFQRALRNLAAGNKLDEADLGIFEDTEGKVSTRCIKVPVERRATFTSAGEGPSRIAIQEEKQEILLPLKAKLVLAQAGAKFLTGLKGDISWPKYSGSQAFWEGENAPAKDGAGTFSNGTVFKPIRLTSYVKFSNMFLAQESINAEQIVINDLTTAIVQMVEKTAFGTHAHAENVPDGLFQKVPTVKGPLTWAGIVGMETAADTNNSLFGNLAYVMHPALLGKAKTSVKDTSGAGGFVFGNDGVVGNLNGYKALSTNNLPSGLQTAKDEYGIVFGNWNDFFIGQWGNIEIKVDPYTNMLTDETVFCINSYWNMGVIRPESFTIASMK